MADCGWIWRRCMSVQTIWWSESHIHGCEQPGFTMFPGNIISNVITKQANTQKSAINVFYPSWFLSSSSFTHTVCGRHGNLFSTSVIAVLLLVATYTDPINKMKCVQYYSMQMKMVLSLMAWAHTLCHNAAALSWLIILVYRSVKDSLTFPGKHSVLSQTYYWS